MKIIMEDTKQSLKNEKKELTKRKENKGGKQKRLSYVGGTTYIIVGILFILFSAVERYKEEGYTAFSTSMFLGMGIVSILMGIILFIMGSLVSNMIIKQYDNKIAEINEELELLDIDTEEYEKRAEVQFKNHQKELKRYYDINLSHLKWVFPVGIVTMVAGICIIVLSIIIFQNSAYLNIAPILIGAISGILIDFIGAVFIEMYIKTIKASTEFHNKLIHSNDNLFANVLITKISNENLKNETFAEVAKIISRDRVEDNRKTENK